MPFTYEGECVRYIVPEREAKYLPDFSVADCPIIIEPKGYFGGNYEFKGKRWGNSKDAAVKERQKFTKLVAVEYEKEGDVNEDMRREMEFARKLA